MLTGFIPGLKTSGALSIAITSTFYTPVPTNSRTDFINRNLDMSSDETDTMLAQNTSVETNNNEPIDDENNVGDDNSEHDTDDEETEETEETSMDTGNKKGKEVVDEPVYQCDNKYCKDFGKVFLYESRKRRHDK